MRRSRRLASHPASASIIAQVIISRLLSECWVPQTVFNEVVAGIGKPGAKSLQASDWQGRVRVSPIPDPLLVMELDAGEADVISLARQLSPALQSSTFAYLKKQHIPQETQAKVPTLSSHAAHPSGHLVAAPQCTGGQVQIEVRTEKWKTGVGFSKCTAASSAVW